MTLRTSHLTVVGVIVVASAVLHGWWTNRWASAASAVTGRDLLQSEASVGDWRPGPPLEVNPADMPENTQTSSRRFESARLGKHAVVCVTYGHPRFVAIHTPDVCYLGSGYKLKSAVRQQTLQLPSGGSAAFYVADFEKNSAAGTESIRVRWCWTADGTWKAPDYPRWHFARAPILYKLYVVHPLADDEDLTGEDPYRKFVADLVPTLGRHLSN